MKSPLSPRLRRRVAASAAVLAMLGGAFIYWSKRGPQGKEADASKSVPPTLAVPAGASPAIAGQTSKKPKPRDLETDPTLIVENSSLGSGRSYDVALDELAAIVEKDGQQSVALFPLKKLESREKLREVAEVFHQELKGSVMPVLYDRGNAKQQASRVYLTGRIVAALQPGVDAEKVAQDHGIKDMGRAVAGDLRAYQAEQPVDALAKIEDLRADPRVIGADHTLIRPFSLNSPTNPRFFPNDTYFFNQWSLLSTTALTVQPPEWFGPGQSATRFIPITNPTAPSGRASVAGLDINLFPRLPFIPKALWGEPFNTTPVWGDWDSTTAGYRGRGVNVGILDDGIDVDHPDFFGRLAFGGHRMLRLEGVNSDGNPTDFEDYLVIQRLDQVGHNLTYPNNGHGTMVAGVIAANADNGEGIAGVAPQSTLVILKIFGNLDATNGLKYPETSRIQHYLNRYSTNGTYSDPVFFGDPRNKLPIQSDKLIAMAFELNSNTGSDGPVMDIKNCSWGAPNSINNYEGPGPETRLARENAITNGRGGKGTIFVHASGTGRYSQLGDANYDGYANSRYAICVSSLANIRDSYPPNSAMDWCDIYSEWGACIAVCAPTGGPYFGPTGFKTPARIADGLTQQGTVNSGDESRMLYTTDWTINRAIEGLDYYGNNRGDAPDVSNGDYTKFYYSTSAAAAQVSGVAALLLEANPRMSWLDVPDILIRTARNHKDPDVFFAANPNPQPGANINALNGIDWSDWNEPSLVDRDWKRNSANLWFNHKYGAGMVDARRAVDRAATEVLIPYYNAKSFSGANAAKWDVADTATRGQAGAVTEIPISISGITNFFRATHVEVTFDKIRMSAIGDLTIKLLSPGGVESILAEAHVDASDNLLKWTFMTTHHWGEGQVPANLNGQWKIRVSDSIPQDIAVISPDNEGQTYRVTLKIHGFDIPPAAPSISVGAEPVQVVATAGRLFTRTFSAINEATGWTWFPTVEAPDAFPTWIRKLAYDSTNTLQPDVTLQGVFPRAGTFEGRLRAVNYAGFDDIRVIFNVIEPTDDAYTNWARSIPFFGPLAANNPFAAGDQDPDDDGIPNVLEFALGGHPTQDKGQDLYSLTVDGLGRPLLTFNRYPTRGKNTYTIQMSHDLAVWTTVATSIDGNPTAVAAGQPVLVGESALVLTGISGEANENLREHYVVQVIDNSGVGPTFFRIRVAPYRNSTPPPVIAPLP